MLLTYVLQDNYKWKDGYQKTFYRLPRLFFIPGHARLSSLTDFFFALLHLGAFSKANHFSLIYLFKNAVYSHVVSKL